ncbi:MAG: hypothetical protein AB1941_21470 [Gemmatimonadota bacterium]
MDPEGYVTDPSTTWGVTLNPHLVTRSALRQHPCIVLLGEPGIGKSTELKAWREDITRSPELPGSDFLWADLKGYSEERLRRRIFESPQVLRWRDGEHRLTLLLDSLDECGIPYLSSLLAEELEALPRDRLSLVVACRTIHWPTHFERDLKRLWEGDGAAVYELAPLTATDVALAARAHQFDAGAFLREVGRLGLGSLASKPLTLRFLLNTYGGEHRLPDSQEEVYDTGFRLLASETSETRREAGAVGSLGIEERLALAARIAGVLVFSSKAAVWTGLNDGSMPAGDISLSSLAGGSEPSPLGEVPATEAALQEVLGTGFFSSRGPDRMGFAHQTYGDYLAAAYVRHRGLRTDQILDLLTHPADPAGRIAPQLRSVAAWIALLVPGMLGPVAERDPEILIGSDVEIRDERTRADLTDRVLHLFDREELVFRIVGPSYRLDKLAHPALAEQLRPWIVGDVGASEGRVAALRIAAACELKELQDEVVRIALDPEEPYRVRIQAAMAAGALADDVTCARLRPLVSGEAGDDPRDQLKGFALQTLWPEQLAAEEVLRAITPPKRASVSGSYEFFLGHKFPEHLSREHLPLVLRWLTGDGARLSSWVAVEELSDGVIRKALDHLDQVEVHDALARVVWRQISRDRHLFSRPGREEQPDPLEDAERRRGLVSAVLPLLNGSNGDFFRLSHCDSRLLRPEDAEWLVEQVLTDSAQADRWAQLVWRVTDWSNPNHVSAIIAGAERSPTLREQFSSWLGHLELNSPESRSLKAAHLRDLRQKRAASRPARASRFEPTAPLIEQLLAEAEEEVSSGRETRDAFWQLLHALRFQPDGRRGVSESVLDISKFPGWQAAASGTRERIVNAAAAYVASRSPDPERTLREPTLFRPDVAGYAAFRLLARVPPAALDFLPAEVWGRWAEVLVGIELRYGSGDDRDLTVLQRARDAAPDEFERGFLRAIEIQISTRESAWGIDALRELLSPSICAALSEKLSAYRDSPRTFEDLLRPLLARGSRDALAVATSTLGPPLPQESPSRDVAVVSARALLEHAPQDAWPVVWEAIRSHEDFAVSVLAGSIDSYTQAQAIAELAPHQLADLYVWLAQRTDAQPRSEDDDSLPGSMERLEGRVLELLTGRGSVDAAAALERLTHELPSRPWLRLYRREGHIRMFERLWSPPRPADVLAVRGAAHNRLVRTDAQLASVVMQSLRKLQQKLRGETSTAFALWNDRGGGIWRPKEEERLSDYIADHLRGDLEGRGIIIGREVQIRAWQGGASGEVPDLYVAAPRVDAPLDEADRVAVLVEVKGCWNPKVLTAMETQLVGRYLADNMVRAGIYVVGWFMCEQWDRQDRRRRATPRMPVEELDAHLAARARALSTGGLTINAVVLDASLR